MEIPTHYSLINKLKRELFAFAKQKRLVKLWWRDDDAAALIDKLKDAINVSADLDVYIHLSSIPDKVTEDLVSYVHNHNRILILQHGFNHFNYESKSTIPSEFGASRDIDSATSDIHNGFEKLQRLFENHFLPVFVPPWNTIEKKFVPVLHQIGFTALSSSYQKPDPSLIIKMRNRLVRQNVQRSIDKNIAEFNTHCDFVFWDTLNSFSLQDMIFELTESLRQIRRNTSGDILIGVLTHHKTHDKKFWKDFSEFITITRENNIIWTDLEIELKNIELKHR